MYTRIVRCTIKPNRKQDFDRTLNTEVLPELMKQSGLVDEVALYEESDPSQFVSITFWTNKEMANRYARDVYPRLISKLENLSYDIVVTGYEVNTSTMHRIAAGKAA